MSRKRRFHLVLISALVLTMTGMVWGLQVSLSDSVFHLDKREYVVPAVIVNESETPKIVSLLVRRRTHNVRGEEQMEDAAQEMIVVPKVLKLAPHEHSIVKVAWIGKTIPEREQAYRLIVGAVDLPDTPPPPSGEGTTWQVYFDVRIIKHLYVVPGAVSPKVVLRQAKIETLETRQQVLRLQIANEGTGHLILDHIEVDFSESLPGVNDTKTIVLSTPELPPMNLLAGGIYELTIPLRTLVKPTLQVDNIRFFAKAEP